MAVSPMIRLMTLSILMAPEYPFGNGVMSATSLVLSSVRPFSSEKVQSSAKYFFHGVWFPETIESYSSWVQRTSSASVIGGSAARRRTEDRRQRTAKAKRMTEIRLRTSKCEIGKTGKSKEQRRTEKCCQEASV